MKKIITTLVFFIYTSSFIYSQSSNEKLLQAMNKGNLPLMMDAIEKGADVDFQDKKGNTTLMYCVKEDKWYFATFLLETFEADPTIKNNKGEDIYTLAKKNDAKEIQFCLDSIDVCFARATCRIGMDYAQELYQKGHFEEAENAAMSNLDFCEEGYGKESEEYLLCLGILVTNYNSVDKESNLLRYLVPVENYVLENYKEGGDKYYFMLSNLAMEYGKVKNYEKAYKYSKIVVEEYKKKKGMESIIYVRALADMSMLFMELELYEEALPLIDEQLKLIEKILGKSSENYGIILMVKMNYYSEIEDWDKGIEVAKECSEIFKLNMEKEETAAVFYATSLMTLGHFYQQKKEYNNVIAPLKEAVEILEKENAATQLSVVRLGLLIAYYETGQLEGIEELLLSNLKLYNNGLLQNISYMDESSAVDYIRKVALNQDLALYTLARLKLGKEKKQELINELYQSYLITKSLGQLGVSKTRTFALTGGNEELEKKYQRYLDIKKALASVIYMTEEDKKEIAKGIRDRKVEADMLEQELSEKSYYMEKQIRDNNATVSFDDLKNTLQPNEIAIDFIYHNYFIEKDEKSRTVHGQLYSAIITHPQFDDPIFIPIENSEKINEILAFKINAEEGMSYIENAQETGKELYESLFQPLESYLKEIDIIHVSLSGRLYEVTLHALPINSNELLMDKYKIHYHGTLRDLIIERKQNNEKPKTRSIALIGNPNFDTDMNRPTEATTRSGFGPLPATAAEVVSIEKISKETGLKTQIFTKETASEKSFVSLAGSTAPDIIHLATHGYFFPPLDPTVGQEIKSLTTGDRIKSISHPLFRSGIILTGGNATWNSKEIMSFENDGILTAFEISNLDLINTDLIVLSACNTGLGDVNSSEGVYGLQRAFKIAGVENMIVSLWEVDDTATRILMEKFYRHYFSGTGLYESLRLAQNEMRKTIKYADPIYWAGFILVE